MLETTKKLFEECDELMEIGMSKMSLNEISEDEFKVFKKTMNLLDTSKKLAIKQAEIIEQQNEKLDKILKLLEKKA